MKIEYISPHGCWGLCVLTSGVYNLVTMNASHMLGTESHKYLSV